MLLISLKPPEKSGLALPDVIKSLTLHSNLILNLFTFKVFLHAYYIQVTGQFVLNQEIV